MLAGATPRQQPAEKVRHHQKRLGHVEQWRPGLAQSKELVNRVERQELQTGDLVDPFTRNLLTRGLDHALGARIAVVHRIAQQHVTSPHQAEIHPPCVNTDTIERQPRTLPSCGALS